jgi:hypothetical protein
MYVFGSRIVFIDFVSSFVYECFGSCIEHQIGNDIILGLLFHEQFLAVDAVV